MMTLRQFYLLKLAEECAEVAQRASKQMQFGAAEIQKDQELTNAQRLRGELNDLLVVVGQLACMDELPHENMSQWTDAMNSKREKLAKYLAYSQSLGMVGVE